MNTKVRVPVDVRVVTGIFFLFGAYSLVDMVSMWSRNEFIINPGVLGLWIGWKLCRLRRIGRAFAVWSLRFLMGLFIFAPVLLLILWVSDVGGEFTVDWEPWKIVSIVLFFAFLYWQHWVLMRPEVLKLFKVKTETKNSRRTGK